MIAIIWQVWATLTIPLLVGLLFLSDDITLNKIDNNDCRPKACILVERQTHS